MSGEFIDQRGIPGDVTEEVCLALGQKRDVFGWPMTVIVSDFLQGGQSYKNARTLYISRETYRKLAPRFVEVQSDRFRHPIIGPTPAIVPLPSWWNAFMWSPIPRRLREMRRAHRARQRQWDTDHMQQITVCDITLHRWGFGRETFWMGGCDHGYIAYRGCSIERARSVHVEIGLTRIMAGA